VPLYSYVVSKTTPVIKKKQTLHSIKLMVSALQHCEGFDEN